MASAPLPPADAARLRAAWDAFVEAQAEAGADFAFTDQPVNWLADAEHPPEAAAADVAEPAVAAAPLPATNARRAAPPRPAADRAVGLPADLAAFQQWWRESPALDPGPLAERCQPEGEAGARLMILADQPEAASGLMYNTASARLLDAILLAAGLTRDQIYWATVLPRRTPAPDWDVLALENLGAVTLRHLALARPSAIMAFGRGSISTLLAPALSKSAGNLQIVNHEGLSIPLVQSLPPDQLLMRPNQKRRAWADWLMLIERLEASCV